MILAHICSAASNGFGGSLWPYVRLSRVLANL
jgi:hypothetical protein